LLFIFTPIIFSNLTVFLSYSSFYIGVETLENLQILSSYYSKLIMIIVLNIVILCFLLLIFLFSVRKKMTILQKSIQLFAANTGDLTYQIKTDLSDEFEYIGFLINKSFLNFRMLLKKISELAHTVTLSSQELSTSSQEISSLSGEQASTIKRIVSTMEDADQLSKNISVKVGEVNKISGKNKDLVDKGYTFIQKSLMQITDIQDTNDKTIDGIKLLGEKINNIWEIVNIINNIAAQTKIIAFNAELEAAAAGDAGKNFQIVASEIRRLADNTTNSTNKIKNKINEIQYSSDNLIIASEEGTEKIKTGLRLSNNLRSIFDSILNSSDITATSAGQIANSIKQQVDSFETILNTLKQISEGISHFVQSTDATTNATLNLDNMINELTEIISKYHF
jgi:methyl-accepting chemotaxis protein